MDLIRKGASLSKDGLHRYSLFRIWDPTKPMVLFVMLNPSTADAEKDDNTIRKCTAMVRGWERYGGFLVGNLFSQRTPSPAALWEMDLEARGPRVRNNKALREMASACAFSVVAWGDHGLRVPGRVMEVLAELKDPHALRLTKRGAPWHPSFMRSFPGRHELIPYSASLAKYGTS